MTKMDEIERIIQENLAADPHFYDDPTPRRPTPKRVPEIDALSRAIFTSGMSVAEAQLAYAEMAKAFDEVRVVQIQDGKGSQILIGSHNVPFHRP